MTETEIESRRVQYTKDSGDMHGRYKALLATIERVGEHPELSLAREEYDKARNRSFYSLHDVDMAIFERVFETRSQSPESL